MAITRHIESPADEGRLLVAAAREAGTSAPVPTCPDWRMRDLVRHTGTVHRWATGFVVEGHPSYHPNGGEPDLETDPRSSTGSARATPSWSTP